MRRVALPASLLACAATFGCCSCPDTAKAFDRWDPLSTALAFRFAVETGDWDYACSCLSAADRAQDVSCLELQLGIEYVLEHPKYGIPIKDMIVDSERLPPVEYSADGRRAKVYLLYEGETDRGIPIDMYLDLFLVHEAQEGAEPRWYIAFEETIRSAS